MVHTHTGGSSLCLVRLSRALFGARGSGRSSYLLHELCLRTSIKLLLVEKKEELEEEANEEGESEDKEEEDEGGERKTSP